MDKNKIKQELLVEIKKTNWCSFLKIVDFLEEKGMPVCGNYSIGSNTTNVIVWKGLSELVVDLLCEMLYSHEIFMYPVEVSTYIKNGNGKICMPLTKHLMPCGGYKKQHWQPVYISTASQLMPEDYKRKCKICQQ